MDLRVGDVLTYNGETILLTDDRLAKTGEFYLLYLLSALLHRRLPVVMEPQEILAERGETDV